MGTWGDGADRGGWSLNERERGRDCEDGSAPLDMSRRPAGGQGAEQSTTRGLLHWPRSLSGIHTRVARLSRVFFLAVILVAPQAQAQKVQVIRNDPGGNVNSYLMAVSSAAAFGRQVRIDGWCASACTLYLGSPYTCVTQRATLAFHAPRGGSAAQNRTAAQVIAQRLPASLGRWYLQNAAHLTGSNHLTLSAQQVVRMGGARYC
jgi:hypothetical protein